MKRQKILFLACTVLLTISLSSCTQCGMKTDIDSSSAAELYGSSGEAGSTELASSAEPSTEYISEKASFETTINPDILTPEIEITDTPSSLESSISEEHKAESEPVDSKERESLEESLTQSEFQESSLVHDTEEGESSEEDIVLPEF